MNHCINCINRLGTSGVWTQREAKRSKGQVVFLLPIRSSVGDPDPQDPHVFGPPLSGFISRRYGSGSLPFSLKGNERIEIMLSKLNFITKF
jgi:hypothetical protein